MAKHLLLVEGKSEQYVIWNLCQQHNVPKTFDVKDMEGKEALLDGLLVCLKERKLTVLGIILDADQNLTARWDAVRDRLRMAGYDHLPTQPASEGTIIAPPDRPKVGVWLMSNNHLSGMLEDFVTELIPDDDKLAPKVNNVLDEIEREELNPYSLIHRQKAFIHTWLAWQKKPGQPMGSAINTHTLKHNQPVAQKFVDWLNRLFNT